MPEQPTQSQRNNKLSVDWFIGVPEDKKKEVEQTVRASTTMKDLLTKIVKRKIEEIERATGGTDQYDTASWAYLQAHRNGQLGQLRGLLTLLAF